MFRHFRIAIAAFLASTAALAQEEVTFPAASTARYPGPTKVAGYLSLPPGATGKLPLVVFMHTAGGFGEDIGKFSFYSAALHEAGIATFNLVLFRNAPEGLPSTYLPHLFGAFKYLAGHPRIAADRIGVMGVSFGGVMAMYAASEMLKREFLGDAPGFAAHALLYPACWVHEGIATGNVRARKAFGGDAYGKLTGAPVHVLAGGRDEVDSPGTCRKFVNALPADARKFVELTEFPDATHAWDAGRSFRYWDRAGCDGKGCQVNVEHAPATADKGRLIVAEFFAKHLKRP